MSSTQEEKSKEQKKKKELDDRNKKLGKYKKYYCEPSEFREIEQELYVINKDPNTKLYRREYTEKDQAYFQDCLPLYFETYVECLSIDLGAS